jgi:4'-phosphopantetheinyl transferase
MRQDHSDQLRPDIDIYYFSLDVSSSERTRLFQFLDESERQRAARYHFDVHRFRFISGRGKLREILADIVNCQPEDIIFGFTEFGKPGIKYPVRSNNIQFNVSKSSVMGAVAVSQGIQIGLDIEQVNADGIADCDLIVESEFTGDEIKWYQKHGADERPAAFYRLWTCKEAYLKALGSGLNDSLDRFNVTIGGELPIISYTELEPGINSAFTLYQKAFSGDFVFCLASKNKYCQIRMIAL